MHEEMHMTQMQFMNTGAREIVSLEGGTNPPLVCQREGIKTGSMHGAYAKGATRECT